MALIEDNSAVSGLAHNPFWVATGCFAVIGCAWLWEEIEATRSIGEKNFGVGILAALALMVTVFLGPAGLAYLAIGIAKRRHDRRLKQAVQG